MTQIVRPKETNWSTKLARMYKHLREHEERQANSMVGLKEPKPFVAKLIKKQPEPEE